MPDCSWRVWYPPDGALVLWRGILCFHQASSKGGVADGIRTRNNKLHKLGLYR